MSERQFTTPMLVQNGEALRLYRLPFADHPFNEDWLQRLLFEHPALLPVRDLEYVFSGLLPLARELPTSVGPLDLVYVNEQGFLTLVETKLWRNPEARRSVVAQIIDYTKDMARWSYSDLVDAVRKVNGTTNGDPLVELVQDTAEEFDESTFIDRVSRNLRLGRFLLLIVGDGIREDVEQMAEYLQQTPQLHFTLGLVEIGLFSPDPDKYDTLFVQPRIVARTREVTRAVVTVHTPVKPGDVEVTLPAEEQPKKPSGRSITEEEFFEELQKSAGKEVVEFARWVLDNCESHGLQLEWRAQGPVIRYVEEESGESITFGQLQRDGRFSAGAQLYRKCKKLGLPVEIAREYIDELGRLVPGASRQHFRSPKNEKESLVYGNNARFKDFPPLHPLAQHKEAWFAAIDRAVTRIRKALSSE